ncbi:MAG TPA: hypothetical protein PKG66_10245 [Methanothrix sp.]|nr:hypothetical protein [Methanothrix sp.]
MELHSQLLRALSGSLQDAGAARHLRPIGPGLTSAWPRCRRSGLEAAGLEVQALASLFFAASRMALTLFGGVLEKEAAHLSHHDRVGRLNLEDEFLS